MQQQPREISGHRGTGRSDSAEFAASATTAAATDEQRPFAQKYDLDDDLIDRKSWPLRMTQVMKQINKVLLKIRGNFIAVTLEKIRVETEKTRKI